MGSTFFSLSIRKPHKDLSNIWPLLGLHFSLKNVKADTVLVVYIWMKKPWCGMQLFEALKPFAESLMNSWHLQLRFKIPNNLSRSQYLAYPFHCALYYACREMKFRAMARRAYKPVTIICTFNHCTSPSTVHWVRSEPLSQDMHAPHTQRLSGDRSGSLSMATWMKSVSRKGTCASKTWAYVDLFVFKQS